MSGSRSGQNLSKTPAHAVKNIFLGRNVLPVLLPMDGADDGKLKELHKNSIVQIY